MTLTAAPVAQASMMRGASGVASMEISGAAAGEASLLTEKYTVQGVQVTGTVKDASNGEPLPGVTVLVENSTTGTATGADGTFRLQATSSDVTLVFSFVGYVTQKVPLQNRSVVNVSLKLDTRALDEVVVVGYGTQKKSDLTGSVSSVSADEINQYPALSATEALQGRSAGVSITSSNGAPGASPRIRVRGGTSINASSDPLYVVDGFAGATPPPPGDIASIEILKDASATAIYGSRGANGVVLITTKRGKSGKTRVELQTSYSTQEVGKRMDVLNASQFAEMMNEVYKEERYPNPASYGEGTDWQDEIFRTGNLQNYQVSASGGSEKLNFYTSVNYFGQDGIVINSDYKRYSGLANLDFGISERIRAGVKLLATRSIRNGVRTQETSGGANGAGVIGSALRFNPILGIYDDQGKFTRADVGDPIDNPYAVATQRQNERVVDMLQSNLFVDVNILEGLDFRTTLGVQTNNGRTGSFIPTTLNEGANTGGTGSISADKNTNIINENYFSFNRTLNDIHTVGLVAGYSYQSYRGEDWDAENRGFISDSFSFWNLDGGSTYQNPSSGMTEWQMSSFYGRANYNFKERYLLTFTGRYDGSSRFGANNKWAFFPSAALAWNVKEEPFLESALAWTSNLKLRGSYGVTGNTEIGSYQSLARFSPTFTIIGGVPVNAVRPTEVQNPDLSWESTQQTNFGVDLGLFNSRVSLTADYYYKKTVDLLYRMPLPPYSGYTSTLQNIGSLENKGWEFGLNTVNVDGAAFQWNTDFNITFNRNKILSLPAGEIIESGVPSHLLNRQSHILTEGQPVGMFYGYIFDGVYQQGDDISAEKGKAPGDAKYRDITGVDENNNLTGVPDGVVTTADRTIIGNPHPDYIFGFNNDFKYKNFDLSVFFQGSVGNDMLNLTRMEMEWMSGKGNASTAALDRWTPTNTDTNVPRASINNSNAVSSRWVEDGSYVRLKNVVLGYNLPSALTEKFFVSNLRLYVSAQNIVTFTDYTGYDPEVSYIDSNRNIGLDYGSYPNVKSYTAGLNITF
ncbi:SusC/RagA family TonB-linked outer membrane protein [Pontibacter flavimaris]|nr:TonB-dependent receptor [Pontibacter flavimaris]